MKIEIAEPGRMTQTGSSLLKLIQNNDMPILDLLVRESVQNSLDARRDDSEYVDVEFLTGEFDSFRLTQSLEGITDALQQRFPGDGYKFLAVKDSHTVGLTGELDYKKVRDNNYGNLLKLIYEISKPQQAEGAGGSWGLGKTVYFRVGIGLVIYYSRIMLSDGKYASRLAVSLVEDETSPDAVIPLYKGQAKRGIAWWGHEVDENVTEPITDEEYIRSFLRIFNISTYDGDETGTMIIIPYIDSEKILSNNQVEYLNGSGHPLIPYWCFDIEEYIRIAVQRWYAPRLNNRKYGRRGYLRVSVNHKGLSFDKMEPIFKVIHDLYNCANHIDARDYLDDTEVEIKTGEIKIIKYLKENIAGTVAFAKVPREKLGMTAPMNKYEPYMYLNSEIRDSEVNYPIVCFTRKPGMIVSYKNVGAWVSSITPTTKDSYIIGIFVLNSWNEMKNSPTPRSLEEYVRKSEMADHTSWSDWSEGTYNPRIITKIQNGVNRLISREFESEKRGPVPKEKSGLGKFLGDMILPPEGFGRQAESGIGKKSPPSGAASKGRRFRVDNDRIRYFARSMMVPVIIDSGIKNKLSKVSLEIQIDSEVKRMSVGEWEQKMGLQTPFAIENCRIDIETIDGKKVGVNDMLPENEMKKELQGLIFRKMYSEKGSCYGMTVSSEMSRAFKIRLSLTIMVSRRDVKSVFIFEGED